MACWRQHYCIEYKARKALPSVGFKLLISWLLGVHSTSLLQPKPSSYLVNSQINLVCTVMALFQILNQTLDGTLFFCKQRFCEHLDSTKTQFDSTDTPSWLWYRSWSSTCCKFHPSRAAVITQRSSTCLQRKNSWVHGFDSRWVLGFFLLFLSLSSVSLIRSLKEEQHYRFSWTKNGC